MRGKILSVIAGVYSVYLEDKSVIQLTPRGKFRFLKIKPLVGDNVEVDYQQITQILDRENVLIRPSICNLDYGIILMSLKEPEYSSYLLDKFITLLNLSKIKPLIVFTKVDLEQDEKKIRQLKEEYGRIGLNVIFCSSKQKQGIDELKSLILGKNVALMGQTGVGKSSLINELCPSANREIGSYSKSLNRGKHQTKEVILYPYEEGFLADTPGFSSLELPLFKEELKEHFPFFELEDDTCFYQDCMHVKEPHCIIQERVQKGIIPQEHYENYKAMLEELKYRKDRYK